MRSITNTGAQIARIIKASSLPREIDCGRMTEEEVITIVQHWMSRESPYVAGLKIDSLNGFLKGEAGVVGVGIPEGAPPVELNFAYGDVSPALITTVPAGGMIVQVDIIILEPFDGVGAALSIGEDSDPGKIMPTNGNDPGTIATYSTFPGLTYSSSTDIYLYINPGAGANAGRGVVLMTINT